MLHTHRIKAGLMRFLSHLAIKLTFLLVVVWPSVIFQPIWGGEPDPALHSNWYRALYEGDVDAVKDLIRKGYKIGARIPPSPDSMYERFLVRGVEYPIQAAVLGGNLDLINFLRAQGADLHVTSQSRIPILHLAVDSPKTLAALLKLKINPAAQDPKGNTVLHLAVGEHREMSQEHSKVLELFRDNSRLKAMRNKAGKTAIDLAIEHGNVTAIKILDPGQLRRLDEHRETKEFNAAQASANEEKKKAAEKAEWLAQNCGKEGFWLTLKLLEEGMENEDESLVRCALKKKPILAQPTMDGRKLHVLYNYDKEKIIEIIVNEASHETLNATTPIGNAFTVLYANFRERMPARWVQVLLRKKVSPDTPSRISDTARELACIYGDKKILKLLPPTEIEKAWQTGSTVWINGNREARILRTCKKGAVVTVDAKEVFFQNSDISEARAVAKPSPTPGQNSDAKKPAKTQKKPPGPENEINEAAEAQSYREARCLEQCLQRCPAPQFHKKPSYGDEVCRNGCFDSCKARN